MVTTQLSVSAMKRELGVVVTYILYDSLISEALKRVSLPTLIRAVPLNPPSVLCTLVTATSAPL